MCKRPENLDSGIEYFKTQHLLRDLKGQTISNSLITMVAQVVQTIVNLGSIIVLARLLSPEDFGLVAMVTAIIGFLRVFNDAGLSMATIQRAEISQAQVSNLFWINLGLGIFMTLILASMSPLIAWFYEEQRLINITLILSLSFVLTGATVQHMALLKRQMRFGSLATIQLISVGLGVVIGIAMGWLGYRYWSLVGMQLSTSLSFCAIIWSVSHWRPSIPSRKSGTRPLVNFGSNIAASSVLWSFARGFDGLLIGRFYGSAALGLYSRAYVLMARPVEQLISPIESVFLSALARLQSNPERYRSMFLRAYGIVTLFSLSITGMLLPLSTPITLVVLGDKWEAAAAILAGFTFLGLYIPVWSISTWLLTSQGRGRDFLMSMVISSMVTIISFLVGLPFGPVGMAFSYSISCLLVNLPAAYYIAGRYGPVTTNMLWKSFFLYIPVWLVVCAVTAVVRYHLVHQSSALQLIICVPVGILVACVFSYLYAPARRAVYDLFRVMKEWHEGIQNDNVIENEVRG